MERQALITLAVLMLVACSPSPDEQIKMKRADIERLEFERRILDANFIRRRAEFQAQTIELRGNQKMIDALTDAYRHTEQVQREFDDQIRRDIDAAIDRLNREITEIRAFR